MSNISYHGTSEENAQKIVGPPANLKINIGKGELGRGFYTGTSIALAAIWAQNRFKDKGVVVEFNIPIQKFVQLKGKVIKSTAEVSANWDNLRALGTETTHLFGYDYIVSPFSTIEHIGSQYKFESAKAEEELNACNKTIHKCGY